MGTVFLCNSALSTYILNISGRALKQSFQFAPFTCWWARKHFIQIIIFLAFLLPLIKILLTLSKELSLSCPPVFSFDIWSGRLHCLRARLDCLTKPSDIMHLTKIYETNGLKMVLQCLGRATSNILFNNCIHFLQFWSTRFCQMADFRWFCKAV